MDREVTGSGGGGGEGQQLTDFLLSIQGMQGITERNSLKVYRSLQLS